MVEIRDPVRRGGSCESFGTTIAENGGVSGPQNSVGRCGYGAEAGTVTMAQELPKTEPFWTLVSFMEDKGQPAWLRYGSRQYGTGVEQPMDTAPWCGVNTASVNYVCTWKEELRVRSEGRSHGTGASYGYGS